MSRLRGWIALAFALASAACGPTIEDVCEDLRSCAEPVGSDCQADGEVLERMADDAGCEDAFSDYLDCLDEASCSWRDACGDLQDSVEDCVGELPL